MREIGEQASEISTPLPMTGQWDAASLVQLIASAVAAVGLLGLAALFAIQGVILAGTGQAQQVLAALLLASGTGFAGMLTLSSAWFALLRLRGRRAATTFPAWLPRQGILLLLLLVILPVALIAGSWLAEANSPVAWLLLPPLHLLAITVPIVWLIHLGGYRLPYGSAQRKWGVFASGLVLGPALIITLEIVLGLMVLAGVLIALSTQPGLLETLQGLVEQLNAQPDLAPEQAAADLLPYLQTPVLLYAAGAFLGVLVPLLEELLKPIGVWLLARRALTPAEGFVAGALSGAGFALMENLGYSAASLDSWAAIVLARSGTAVMHIGASALVGWGLAATWRDGRFLRLVAAYLAAVFIHGLWNVLTVSFGVLGTQATGMLDDIVLFQVIAAGVLGMLMLLLLLAMNAALRREASQARNAPLAQNAAPRHAIMPAFDNVSAQANLSAVETISSNEETSDHGTPASTG